MSVLARAARGASNSVRALGPVAAGPARVIDLYGGAMVAVEDLVRKAVRTWLGDTDHNGPLALTTGPTSVSLDADPRTMMSDLLAKSLDQNAASSQRDYYVALLRQLLPDEARIIAALADGTPAPSVSVHRRSNGEVLLDNACLVGRTAAVTLPSKTRKYVNHLLRLGLVELGPEDEDNTVGYELVLADREVRPALKEGAMGKVPAKVVRRTVVLSQHGRDLWEATRPDAGDVTGEKP